MSRETLLSDLDVQGFKVTNVLTLGLANGVGAAVAPAGKGALRYNDSTKRIEASVDAGGWAALSGTFSGALADKQIAHGTAANTIGGSNDFAYDYTTGRVALGLTAAAATFGRMQVRGSNDSNSYVVVENAAGNTQAIFGVASGADGFMGTLSNHPFVVRVNNTEVGRWTAGKLAVTANAVGGYALFELANAQSNGWAAAAFSAGGQIGGFQAQGAGASGSGAGTPSSFMVFANTATLNLAAQTAGDGIGFYVGGFAAGDRRLKLTGTQALFGAGSVTAPLSSTGLYVRGATSDCSLGIGDGAVDTLMGVSNGNQGYVGTLTAHPLGFLMGGFERARISANANLLVGTNDDALGARLRVTNANAATSTPIALIETTSASGIAPLVFRVNGTTRAGLRSDFAGNLIQYANGNDFFWVTGLDPNDGGTVRMTLNASGVLMVGTTSAVAGELGTFNGVLGATVLRASTSGSAGAPAFSFNGDQDTGMYRVGTNSLGFAVGGNDAAIITNNRNLLLGTTTDTSGVRLKVENAAQGTVMHLRAPWATNTDVTRMSFFTGTDETAQIWAQRSSSEGTPVSQELHLKAATAEVLLTADLHFVPVGDNTHSLGTAAKRWSLVRGVTITSGDLELGYEDGEGEYVIREGRDGVYIEDKRSGRRGRFAIDWFDDEPEYFPARYVPHTPAKETTCHAN